MSTIKVDTIATRTGSGNITASNTIAGTSATLSGTLGVTGNTTMGGTAAITGNTTVGGTLVNTGLVTASAGVAIGGTGSANTLDDYEEGTFTPSVGGNATYISQIGKYVKIGRSVTIKLEMQINVLGTGSTSSVSGIPFTADTEAPLAVAKATNTSGSYGSIQARIAGSTLYYMTRQGNVSSQGTNTAIHGNNFLIQVSGSYITGT